MRMAGPDILLFIVGALLLSGATYAIIQQGGVSALSGGGGAVGAFTVTFPTKSVDAGKAPVADFGSSTVTLPIKQGNVTKLTLTVQCSDQVPGGTFQFTVQVAAPNGLKVDPKNGVCGTDLKIDVPVATAPPTTAAASNDPSALPTDANATRAVGDWKLTIQGSRGGVVPGLPAGNPSGNVLASAEVWEPKFETAGK
jgi:hypothetical protein